VAFLERSDAGQSFSPRLSRSGEAFPAMESWRLALYCSLKTVTRWLFSGRFQRTRGWPFLKDEATGVELGAIVPVAAGRNK